MLVVSRSRKRVAEEYAVVGVVAVSHRCEPEGIRAKTGLCCTVCFLLSHMSRQDVISSRDMLMPRNSSQWLEVSI